MPFTPTPAPLTERDAWPVWIGLGLLFFVYISIKSLSAIAPWLSIIYERSVEYLGRTSANIVGVVLVFIFGLLLFWFREAYRSKYGLLEVAFGLVSGWFAVSKFEAAGYAESLGLVAAVYLVVRGMDNYKQGRSTTLAIKA